jgi:hypothetical protein
MKRYQSVEVSEAQLEDLVRQGPELIEAGLDFVDHQAFTERGPLDVLKVDSGRALVVAELKVVEDDGMLVQGVDYYDYIVRNLDGFARAYKQHKINPEEDPRLFLIAPSFSVTLLNRVKWLEIPVSLFTYQCIEFPEAKGELVPIFHEVTAPGLPEVKPEAYALDDRYAYITDSKVRAFAQEIVAEIQGWDQQKVLVEAIKYAISIKCNGKVLAYLEPRRKHFLLSTFGPDGKWTPQAVHTESDHDTAMPMVRACFERLRGERPAR